MNRVKSYKLGDVAIRTEVVEWAVSMVNERVDRKAFT